MKVKKTWKTRDSKKKIFEYDVYCSGVTNKIEKRCTMEAYDLDEATRKAERFALMAGLNFSHVKSKDGQ